MTLISVFFLLCVYLCHCLCFCLCLSLNSLSQFLPQSLSLPLSRQKKYFAIITYDDVQRAVHHHCFRQGNHKLSPYLFLHNIRYKMLYDIHFCITILFHRHIISAIVRIQCIQNECVMLCFECFANEFCHNKLKLKAQLAIPKDKCDCVPTKWCQQGFI